MTMRNVPTGWSFHVPFMGFMKAAGGDEWRWNPHPIAAFDGWSFDRKLVNFRFRHPDEAWARDEKWIQLNADMAKVYGTAMAMIASWGGFDGTCQTGRTLFFEAVGPDVFVWEEGKEDDAVFLHRRENFTAHETLELIAGFDARRKEWGTGFDTNRGPAGG